MYREDRAPWLCSESSLDTWNRSFNEPGSPRVERWCPVGSPGQLAVQSWHGTDSHPTAAPLRWTCPVITAINAFKKSRLSKKFASFQPGWTSRLLYGRSVAFFICQKTHPMKVASLKQYHLCFSKRTSVRPPASVNQFNSTLAQADDRPLLA